MCPDVAMTPIDFPIGSPETRAATRAILKSRMVGAPTFRPLDGKLEPELSESIRVATTFFGFEDGHRFGD
jgi:hypothetical protein